MSRALRILVICSVLGMAAILAGCAPAAPKQLTRLQFQMPWIPPVIYPAFVMAQEKGFYAEEGLDVEVLEGSGSGNAVKVVGAGTVPIGDADANRILSGAVQGVPVTPVMSFYYSLAFGVVSLKQQGITKFEHLIGKKVGSAPGSATTLLFQAALAKAGVDINKVNMVSIAPETFSAALIKGEVDAIPTQSEGLNLAVEGIETNWIPLAAQLDIAADHIFVNNDFLKKEPETVRAFLRATIKGVNYVKDNQAKTLEVLAKKFPTLDPRKTKLIVEQELGFMWMDKTPKDKFGLQRIEPWETLQNYMFEQKAIDKKIDVKSWATNDYLPYK